MRLEDIITIVLALAGVATAVFVLMAMYAYWPQICALLGALRARYIRSNWQEWVSALADGGVSGFVDDEERVERPLFVNRPRTMSSTGAIGRPVPGDTAGIDPVSSADLARLARDLTEDQFLELVLRRKKPSGEWFISGKKLFTHAGGNYNRFCEIAKRARGASVLDDEGPTSITPIAGRVSHAQYADPDLDFEPLDV